MERAVKAARAAGLDVGTVEVTREGTIRVMVGASTGESAQAETPFDTWKAKRDAGPS
ncbi:hypothetical protein [Oceanicola sp. 502str15]|uniref:hypothetical protein n=1 Tax=Oceanicola sp. 502str15 TaxID=2696061 RepID=UPI0020941BB2|nr:hypothetical protein [Oceanicola sp. 502str15]